jgi:hypothetical protein
MIRFHSSGIHTIFNPFRALHKQTSKLLTVLSLGGRQTDNLGRKEPACLLNQQKKQQTKSQTFWGNNEEL